MLQCIRRVSVIKQKGAKETCSVCFIWDSVTKPSGFVCQQLWAKGQGERGLRSGVKVHEGLQNSMW